MSISSYVKKCRRQMSGGFEMEIKACQDCPDHPECVLRSSDPDEFSYYIEGGM